MKVTYLNHSGILVELNNRYCIFDYYRGELPLLDRNKEVIVFCSHVHEDHYNPLIFDLLDEREMRYQAVLANDISDEKRLLKIKHSFVESNQSYQLDGGLQVETLLSNDSGVAFIVRSDEGTIYHSGDLNDWYWEGEPEEDNLELRTIYHAEIGKIKGRHFDLAFVPLDPRLEMHYADGLLYFLENVDCDAVYPIHYWGDPSVIQRFITEYPEYQSRIRNTEAARG
ncbi:MBL fold metallo-hydrolase [Solobacterium moorei]|uniref:MBL fold metallo-hydrolase n=1 Tax=Solobacterium moorei TaxID=102148 RepID=UPI0023F50CD6|nr:MBL fold metallo-hydrolase [Solobacterium moorei]